MVGCEVDAQGYDQNNVNHKPHVPGEDEDCEACRLVKEWLRRGS